VPSDTPHPEPPGRGDFVLATYREIALRFGLGGPNAARTKVKRAAWGSEPSNHPADPLRIRVPRETWDQAGETLHREPRERAHPERDRDATSQKYDTSHIKALQAHIATLRAQLAEAEQRLAREAARADQAEARADQATADLRAERDSARRLTEDLGKLTTELGRLAGRPEPETGPGRWRGFWTRLFFGET